MSSIAKLISDIGVARIVPGDNDTVLRLMERLAIELRDHQHRLDGVVKEY